MTAHRARILVVALLFIAAPMLGSAHASGLVVGTDGVTYDWNGDDTRIWEKLWSDDEEKGLCGGEGIGEIFEDIGFECQNDYTSTEQYANVTDWKWNSPPTLAQEWNRQDIHDYSPGGTGYSAAPTDANLNSNGKIKDAYIEFAAVNPSTVTHRELNGPQRHLVSSEGTVYATLDYKIDVPANETASYPKKEYYITSHEIKSVKLINNETDEVIINRQSINGNTIDKSLVMDYYDYTDANDGLKLKVTISAVVKKDVTKKLPHDDNDDDDDDDDDDGGDVGGGTLPPPPPPPPPPFGGGFGGFGGGFGGGLFGGGEDVTDDIVRFSHTKTTTSTVFDGEVTATDSITVRSYEPNPEALIVEYPTSRTDVRLTMTEGYWDSVALPDGRIDNVWRYYSTGENAGWPEDSGVKFAQIHSYPHNESVRISDENVSVISVEGYGDGVIEAPDIPDNIDIDGRADEYQSLETITFSYPNGEITDNMIVEGQLQGTAAEPDIVETKQIYNSSISAEVVDYDQSQGHSKLRIELTREGTDQPISTERGESTFSDDSRDEDYIRVDGKNIETNSSGVATVWVENRQVGYTIEYHPRKWYNTESGQTYLGDTTYIETSQPSESVMDILNLIFGLLLTWIPIFILIYVVDRAFNLGIWPPWKNISWLRFDKWD